MFFSGLMPVQFDLGWETFWVDSIEGAVYKLAAITKTFYLLLTCSLVRVYFKPFAFAFVNNWLVLNYLELTSDCNNSFS